VFNNKYKNKFNSILTDFFLSVLNHSVLLTVFKRFGPHIFPAGRAIGGVDLGPLNVEDLFGEVNARVSVLEALVGEGVSVLGVHLAVGSMLLISRLEPSLELCCGKCLHLLFQL